jgi:futalosine hydrolase
MKILLIAATEVEIPPVNSTKHQLNTLVTGPGMVATVYELTRHLHSHKYDLVINCGLAGSFDRSIPLGEIVQVTEDVFSELGAENDTEFLDLEAIGLTGKIRFQNNNPLNIEINKFRKVKSITVNTVHGNETSIEKIKKRLNPHVETMEGAAFYFVCEKENIPTIQLRAISNYVEKRNKEAWKITLALENLTREINQLIENIPG